jgi:Subtilase family/Secretion system C-terminal sorting domain
MIFNLMIGFIKVQAQQFYSNEIYCRATITNALPLFTNGIIPGTTSPAMTTFINLNTITEIRKAFDVTGRFLSDNTYVIKFTDTSKLNTILNTITTQPNINYACKKQIVTLFCTTEATNYWQGNNDKSFYLKQTNFCKTMSTFTNTGTPVKLGIVDNGFNTSHQAFINGANNVFDIANSYDVSDGNANINPPANCPIFRHGTAMASVAGEQNNDNLGGASLARTSTNVDVYKILGIKATFDKNDFGLGAKIIDNGFNGILKAAQNGAKVISCSWGFGAPIPGYIWNTPDGQLLYDIMDLYPDILIIFGAGNTGSSTYICLPAAANPSNWEIQLTPGAAFTPVPTTISDRIISVGAIDATNKKPFFSCYGPEVDIFTYGTNIYAANGNSAGSTSYEYFAGTSLATPQVAAVAAMYRFKYPTATAIATKNAILAGATNIEGQNPSFIGGLGSGKLDIYNAINNISSVNHQIRINLSQTQFCLSTLSTFSITISNLPSGLSVSSISTKIPGLSAIPYAGTNITGLTFANPGIYDVTISITLSNASIYEYQTGLTVYDNKVNFLPQSENPVCENNAVQMILENKVYGVARRVEYTGNTILPSIYFENTEGNNKNYDPFWVSLNSATIGYPNPVLTIGQASFFDIDYSTGFSSFNATLTCPIVNSNYTYNVTCCDANTITNGDFNTIGASAIGFNTDAIYFVSASTCSNRFVYTTSYNFAIPGASNGSKYYYNGPYDNTNVTAGGASLPPQNIIFAPAPIFDNWFYSNPGLKASIWNQSQSLVLGKTYNFSFNLLCENPVLDDLGLPLNIDVTITNGTYTLYLIARSYNKISYNGTTSGYEHFTYQAAISNFAGPSGTYTISINQKDNFSGNYFNTLFDDIRLLAKQDNFNNCGNTLTTTLPSILLTTPIVNLQGYQITTPLTITGNVTFTNTDISIKNGAGITVNSGATLTIIASHLHGCTAMWQGITVNPGGKIIVKGNTAGASSFIEDALTSIKIPNHTSIASILDVSNTIFNNHKIGIDISNYTQNTSTYPFKIENNVFTARKIPSTCGAFPNWPTVASLQVATINPLNVLPSPYTVLNAYTPATLLGLPAEKTQTHIKATTVGYTGGTITAPIYSGVLNINTIGTTTVVPAINLLDNAKFGILATNANINIVNNVVQFCENGIIGAGSLFTKKSLPQQPYSSISICNTPTSTNTTAGNKFFDNKLVDISIGIYSQIDIIGNEFRSTQSKSNLVTTTFPTTNNNTVGKVAINIDGQNTLMHNIKFNKILNHKVGIVINQAMQKATSTTTTTLAKHPGDVQITNNIIKPADGLFGTLQPFISEGITASMTGGNLATTFTNVAINNRLNIADNTIDKVYRGIEISSYQWPSHFTRITDNIINQDVDPNTSTLSMQHGIWCNLTRGSLFVKSNKVNFTGTIPASVASMAGFFNTNANVSGRQANFRMDQNDKQVITCNTSIKGMIAFEFNGASANTQWRNSNDMQTAPGVQTHFLGLLLNNGGIIGVQPAGINAACASNAPNLDAGNIFSFTSSAALLFPKHTWVQNAATIPVTLCNPTNTNVGAGLSGMQVPSGGPTRPATNSGDLAGIRIYANIFNNSFRLGFTPAVSCAPPLAIAAPGSGGTIGNLYVLNAVANGLSFEAMSTELNYMNKAYLYTMQKANPEYITASPDLQAFYNTADAPSNAYRKLYDIEMAIANADATSAQIANSAFVPNNKAEINTKTYNAIAIKVLQEIALSATDNTDLLRIANECPHTDGACVYAARILYNKLAMASTGDYISFPDDCNPSGLYKTDTKVMLPDSKYFDVQIVPNPNNGNFDIVINQGNANTLDVTLTDMLGKVYKKQLLQIVNNHASIHANVAAGVYFLTCKNSENETVVKKIIIQ